MNEFKIVISAINAQAKKAIKEVKDEIDKANETAKKGGKSISDSLKSVAKGAAVAVGAVAGVATALTALGKSTLELQKDFNKLNSAFQAAGSTAAQAQSTYKNLYRFMGDSGAAVEASQSLASLTNDEKALNEYTKILQGTYATFGSTLPVESLAEAINHTAKLGTVQGTFADAIEWAGGNVDDFNQQLATCNNFAEREALIRSTLNSIYSNAANIYERNNGALMRYNESQVALDIALANTGRLLLPLMTSLNNLAATLLTVLSPAFQIVANVIAIFVEYIIIAVQWVSAFFSLFTGGSGGKAKETTKSVSGYISDAGKSAQAAASGVGNLGGALNKAAGAAKELKKQTMGFDELNVVQKQETTSGASAGAGGGGGAIALPDLSSLTTFDTTGIEVLEEKLEETKEKLKAILILAGSVAGAFLLFNAPGIIEAVKGFDLMSSKLRFILGDMMAIAGAILLVVGYSDAWVNGLDWGNFTLIMAGAALTIGGLALAFGGTIAAIAAVGIAIAALILGLKDFMDNGASVQNILMIIIGIVGIFAATWYAATLPVAAVVAAIAAVIAIIVICVKHWDDIKAAAGKAWEWIKGIWEKVANWFNEKVIQPIVKFFQDLWAKITEIFGKVKEWFSEKFTAAWEAIKAAWGAVGEWFSGLWQGIKNAFSAVKTWFSDTFSAAWQAIKNVFSNWGSFFSGLWDSIKNTFSALGTKISDAIGKSVKSGINGIITMIENTINSGIALINGAIGLINKIPGVNVGLINRMKLPRLANGGIVDSATIAMIGENGKEAVVPLENNTEWMDKLADRLSNNTPSKIVLMLDSKELGWANIHSINNITKQTGTLPLVLA
jgi:phage-related protein